MNSTKRFKLIACEIMFREFSFCAAQCENIIDIAFMPKGLHDIGERKMSEKLQNEIDKVDSSKYEAILLGYGLCNNGISGLHSHLPLVVPRAHDCITLLLGSRERYSDYFNRNPGTFYKSTGWVERDVNPNDNQESVMSQLGINRTYQEYVEQYGEENAKFLMDSLGGWLKNYKKYTYIDTNTGDFQKYKELTKQQAQDNGWEYEEVQGDINLLSRLLAGDWDNKDFLIIPPGNSINATNNEDLITFEPAG